MIAIHHRENSFSDYWIKYCQENNLDFKLVNAGSNNIIEELRGCEIFMWNWVYFENVDIKIAIHLIYVAEKMGVKVFPSINTCLFFDDKLTQKYLLEASNLPLVKTYVFFQKREAYEWIKKTTFPKVFKLRGGASSDNVWLVKTKKKARKLTKKMFSSGIRTERKSTMIKERIWALKRDKSVKSIHRLFVGFFRYLFPKEYYRFMEKQSGYVYFQDFVPGMTHDIRIVVIGNKAFGGKRITRKGDFRASGSGIIDHSKEAIDWEFYQLAFEINKKLKFQSIAFDFIKKDGKIFLFEISYTFPSWIFKHHSGYYNNKGEWIKGSHNPANFIIEDILNE